MTKADKPAREAEQAVKSCYSTWSGTYYDEYYRSEAAYPPVHVGIVRDLLVAAGARSVLDAGCGPASMLRELADLNLDRYGFDLTPQMVAEAKRVLAPQGVPDANVWEGSVTDPSAFRALAGGGYDAALCFGVLPHIRPEDDRRVIENLARAVRPGGLVMVEARNQLFALFTLNRYSRDLFHDALIDLDALRRQASAEELPKLEQALALLDARFRLDLPPVRTGKAGEPGYDEVLSRTHNPLVLRELAATLGLADVEILFYHYHCLPPLAESSVPRLFRAASLAMEDPRDWRGHFMASAFILAGRKAAEP